MAKGAPTGFIDFEIVGNERGVQEMLNVVDTALSPVGLASFLGLAVAPWIKQRAAERFANEGDDASGKWAPLEPVTVEIREKSGFQGPGPINRRTGELEDYITQGAVGISTGPGMGALEYPKGLPPTKSLKEKMETAQRGKTRRPQTVPRPVLAMNETDLSHVLVLMAMHVQGEGVSRGYRANP